MVTLRKAIYVIIEERLDHLIGGGDGGSLPKLKLHQTTFGNISGHVITGSLAADIVHNARQAATWCNRVTGSRFPPLPQ